MALLGAACGDLTPSTARSAPDETPSSDNPPADTPSLVIHPRVVNLGRLRPGAGLSRRIKARATSPDLLITGARTGDPGFSVEPDASPLPGRRATFTLRFKGSRKLGPLGAEVAITHRDAAGTEGEAHVTVVGSVAGDIRVTRGIYLHRRGGRFAPRDVVVGRRSGRSVRITSVEDPDGLLDVALVEPVSRLASFRLEVADPATREDGAVGHPLLLHVDKADESPISMEYRIDSGRE